LILDLKNTVSKPIAIILHSYASGGAKTLAKDIGNSCVKEGFAVFLSIQSAAVALNRYVEHQQWLKSL
jgi:hypothetical protein